MPAEWAPHEATLIAWPTHSRQELWGDLFDDAQREYATVANAVAAFEPVVMVVDPTQEVEARGFLTAGVELLPIPIDDLGAGQWPDLRRRSRRTRAVVDFRFNGWGGRYTPYDLDDALPAALASHFGVRRYRAPFVLEGGAITVDGEGTALNTASCVLNANRNPGRSQSDVDKLLRDYLGLRTVLWFAQGWSQTRDTDGHVDGIAMFTRPAELLLLDPSDPSDPDAVLAVANKHVLSEQLDAAGRSIEICSLDPGEVVDVPYANIYLGNGFAIVPGGTLADDVVRVQVEAALPGREIVQVPARTLHEGGGGPHCITQQVPAPSR
jgi:agmatine deiminase